MHKLIPWRSEIFFLKSFQSLVVYGYVQTVIVHLQIKVGKEKLTEIVQLNINI